MTRSEAPRLVGAALDGGPPPWLAAPLLALSLGWSVVVTSGLWPRPLATAPLGAEPTFERVMEKGYREGWFMAWLSTPERLADYMDVEAARGFVQRHMDDRTASQVNLVCTAYQLGMHTEELPAWDDSAPWRQFWRYDLYPFAAYYLLSSREPSAPELAMFGQHNRAQLLRDLQWGVPEDWRDRHDVVRSLRALRLAEAWPDPAVQAPLQRWSEEPREREPGSWDAYVDALLCQVADLDCDLESLRSFSVEAWDGRGYPSEGCGSDHCATKYLINSAILHHALGWPIEQERCEGWMAGLAALQNPDGSFRTGLDDPRSEEVMDAVGLYHCSAFCQLHMWEIVNAMGFLAQTCAPDPQAVARRVAALREGAAP